MRRSSVLTELNRRFLTAAGPQSKQTKDWKWIRIYTASYIKPEMNPKKRGVIQIGGKIILFKLVPSLIDTLTPSSHHLWGWLSQCFPPRVAAFCFISNRVCNISLWRSINCFYNGGSVQPFEPCLFVLPSAAITDHPNGPFTVYERVGACQWVSDMGSWSEAAVLCGHY